MSGEKILSLIEDELSGIVYRCKDTYGALSFDIRGDDITRVVSCLCMDKRLDFPLLVDIAGVDYSDFLCYDGSVVERFAVIYILYSFKHDQRIKVRAFVPSSNPKIASIYSIYKGALLTEREVYDMYGIVFTGHPNLKRLLMPDEFVDFPLRKSYPLRGKGERTVFPKYNIYNKTKED